MAIVITAAQAAALFPLARSALLRAIMELEQAGHTDLEDGQREQNLHTIVQEWQEIVEVLSKK
ncbi:hypothetical protein SAMN02787142_7830 [Burkholderia sp. WP9]|nr:hypothetical protein SAMN02787142_7830 [Burkholderia sp. WP9]